MLKLVEQKKSRFSPSDPKPASKKGAFKFKDKNPTKNSLISKQVFLRQDGNPFSTCHPQSEREKERRERKAIDGTKNVFFFHGCFQMSTSTDIRFFASFFGTLRFSESLNLRFFFFSFFFWSFLSFKPRTSGTLEIKMATPTQDYTWSVTFKKKEPFVPGPEIVSSYQKPVPVPFWQKPHFLVAGVGSMFLSLLFFRGYFFFFLTCISFLFFHFAFLFFSFVCLNFLWTHTTIVNSHRSSVFSSSEIQFSNPSSTCLWTKQILKLPYKECACTE